MLIQEIPIFCSQSGTWNGRKFRRDPAGTDPGKSASLSGEERTGNIYMTKFTIFYVKLIKT